MVAVLAGGTGGAKLAAGLAEHDDVTVIANTGDDVEIYGVHVSPDPDLVTWWLAGIIDERGWGIAGDTFEEMKRQDDPWFQLGDRDLELCRLRTDALARGRAADGGAREGGRGRRRASTACCRCPTSRSARTCGRRRACARSRSS